MALQGDRFYRAVTQAEIEEARNGSLVIRLTPTKPVPPQWLGTVAGKRILCLASGGARQAPLLAAAGAEVVVFDLSEQQLARDQEVAEQAQLKLVTIAGDMRDLGCFDDREFDLIVSPCATCFCPAVQPIWDECFRVLRDGGKLMTGFINPLHYIFDAVELYRNRFVVRHKIPYSDLVLDPETKKQLSGPDRPLEFGHSLDSLIGGQLEAGFLLVGFFDDHWGGGDPLSKRIATFAATLVEKPTG